MEKVSLATQLTAVFTAFAAFSMPIALELLNRVKSKFGSPYYIDELEEVLGFKITNFVRQLFAFILFYAIYVLLWPFILGKNPELDTDYSTVIEALFFCSSIFLLFREFDFLKIVYEVTKSDTLIQNHILKKLGNVRGQQPISKKIYNSINLLIQIARYNIESSKVSFSEQTHALIFDFIRKAYQEPDKSLNMEVVDILMNNLAPIISSSRKTGDRVGYISIQRSYGGCLIEYYDSLKYEQAVNISTRNIYAESVQEMEATEYFLCVADFLLATSPLILKQPHTLFFIDKHIRDLLNLLVDVKPELVCVLMDNYRNFNNFESYFPEEFTTFYYQNLSLIEGDKELLTKKKEKIDFIFTNELINRFEEIANELNQLLEIFYAAAVEKSVSLEEKIKIDADFDEHKEELHQELLKGLGVDLAKATGRLAISLLGEKHRWESLLLCLNKFDFSGTNISVLGTRIYPDSYHKIVRSLSIKNELGDSWRLKTDFGYVQSIPLLLMQQHYASNIGAESPDFNYENVGKVSFPDLSLRQLFNCLSNLKKAYFYSQSDVYAEVFCYHHNLMHEVETFQEATWGLIEGFIEEVEASIKEMESGGEISEAVKERFRKEFVDSELKYLSKNSLLTFIKKIDLVKEENKVAFNEQYSRIDFMENTGVYHSFTHSYVLRHFYYKLLYSLITKRGKSIESFDSSELKPGDYLVIATSDIDEMTEVSGRNLRHYRRDIDFHLASLPAKESMERYYIYRPERDGYLINLYTSSASDNLGELYADVLDVEFEDNRNEIKVVKTANLRINV